MNVGNIGKFNRDAINLSKLCDRIATHEGFSRAKKDELMRLLLEAVSHLTDGKRTIASSRNKKRKSEFSFLK